MRPRVFPAEDFSKPGDYKTGVSAASMRPRVFPAEDEPPRAIDAAHVGASMRPRVFPAEDPSFLNPMGFLDVASMRPRVFPAEDAIMAGVALQASTLQ